MYPGSLSGLFVLVGLPQTEIFDQVEEEKKRRWSAGNEVMGGDEAGAGWSGGDPPFYSCYRYATIESVINLRWGWDRIAFVDFINKYHTMDVGTLHDAALASGRSTS